MKSRTECGWRYEGHYDAARGVFYSAVFKRGKSPCPKRKRQDIVNHSPSSRVGIWRNRPSSMPAGHLDRLPGRRRTSSGATTVFQVQGGCQISGERVTEIDPAVRSRTRYLKTGSHLYKPININSLKLHLSAEVTHGPAQHLLGICRRRSLMSPERHVKLFKNGRNQAVRSAVSSNFRARNRHM